MNQPKSSSELTSTLHLGVRSVVDGSPESALSALLTSATESDLATFTGILDGPADRAMVVIHRGPAKGARFLVDQSQSLIGRESQSHIFLDDVTVSRKHAAIEIEDGVFILRDLGSLNGTYLNNQSVTKSSLRTGDEIQIGKFHMLFITKNNLTKN